MDQSSSPDRAFFYLWDYTTPIRRRIHHRQSSVSAHSSPQLHLEKANTRRTHYLEAKRARLAVHHANIHHVLTQYKLDDTPQNRRESLLDKMARADDNRDRLLKLTAENCGRKVEEAKIRASKVKKERDEVARLASLEILERLESAERRREELLSARGRKSLSRISRNEAAIRIQRVWRKQRLQKAIREFQAQRISLESVANHTFDQVVGKFKNPGTVRAATRLLLVVGLVDTDVGQQDLDRLVRTFLSSFMIVGHTTEVLHSHDQALEMVTTYRIESNIFQDLIAKANQFVNALERYNHVQRSVDALSTLWQSYLSAFQDWKAHDASVLVEMLVGKFVDLDLMLLDIQNSPTMQAVVEEYTQGIKDGQMHLLQKIRLLIGDKTRD